MPSATPAPDDAAFRRAVAEALEELRAARKLIEAQKADLQLRADLLKLEREINEKLKGLREMDGREILELRNANAAAQRAITSLEAANAVLKKNQWSFGKALKYVVYGTAAGFIIGTVLSKR